MIASPAQAVYRTSCKETHLIPLSRMAGVSWSRRRQLWNAQISVTGLKKNLGYFTEEEAAARAYNEAALKYHGSKASLNGVAPAEPPPAAAAADGTVETGVAILAAG
jgi:hypothetical protein